MDKHHPTIGLPRAMLYYRYRTLWQTFFRELEIPVVTSPLTDRSILEQGTALMAKQNYTEFVRHYLAYHQRKGLE